jgi:hypothetical protein
MRKTAKTFNRSQHGILLLRHQNSHSNRQTFGIAQSLDKGTIISFMQALFPLRKLDSQQKHGCYSVCDLEIFPVESIPSQ